MILHPYYKGKIATIPKCCIRDFKDFAIWYTPGVAAPCKEINRNPESVYEHTNKANLVAVVSDGTRVLGLGDIGPEAGLPVMEGKAILFKYLGGVDAFPICLDTKDPDKIIETVKILQPSFGGINLEDISQPKCFRILDTLRAECHIPVWHDDQQGTAAVTLAGLINAVKVVGKKLSEVRVAMIGAGAANIAISRVLIGGGVTPGNIIMTDTKGILFPERADKEELKAKYKEKWHMATVSNHWGIQGGAYEAVKGSDVIIALSSPGSVKAEWIREMAPDPIIFVCANPVPEIWPWEAKAAGARIVATGRSDFPNQVNNSVGFPGIFRGTLDVRAKTITDEMCIAAAVAIAETAEKKGLHEDYIMPTMDDWEVFPNEAAAVGHMAVKQGVARLNMTRDEIYKIAAETIRQAREEIQCLMKEGFIRMPK
ncbi:MAG: NADP-dependent malic enzyme [Candidatus Brocadiia bacterium]